MSILKDLNFVKGESNLAASIFEGLTSEGKTFLDVKYSSPSEYINYFWDKYQKVEKKTANRNGKVFELIVSTLLYRENLKPLYIQAEVAFVPNVDFDALLYSKEVGPIALSMKTSLRERYKQADLEAIALKYVHRKAKSYLLTMDENEARITKEKIVSGSIIGLDKIILCSGEDMDSLIADLKNYQYTLAGSVEIIKSTQVVK